MTVAQEATMIRLSRTAPWNTSLHAGIRYVQVGEHRFTAELAGGVWSVWEVDHDGLPLNRDYEGMFVAHAFSQKQVREAIEMRLDGKSAADIRTAMITSSRVGTGTGRSHPRNVAARRNWKA